MAEYNPSKIIKDGNTYNFRDTTKIPLSGSNAISGSLIPSTDGTVDLGGPSYQWNNAYIKSLTINGVACGDILTHNASEFVNVTTAQTVGGQKIFEHGSTGFGRDSYHFTTVPYGKNTPPANTSFQYIWFGGNTASQGFANSWYGGFLEQVINTDGSARGSWIIRNTSDNRMGIQLSESADGSSSSLIPVRSAIDLGTSTNKWKSFNGINPGALSLPIVDSGVIAVDTTTFQWGTNWSYTPVFDGWIAVDVPASSATKRRYAVSQESLRYWYPNQNGEIFRFSFPVVKGVSVNFAFISDINEPAAPTINLLKAQGNV